LEESIVKPRELEARKYHKIRVAGERWRSIAPDVAQAAALLAEGGPRRATGAVRVAQFVARESLKRASRFGGIGLERMIGDTLDLDEMPPNLAARKAGQPIARIVEMIGPAQIGTGFATGFLVSSKLLLTNWHVFAAQAEAVGCGAQFGFEVSEQGLIKPGVVFELDPGAFFIADEGLDIALVGVKPTAALGTGSLEERGTVRLIPGQGKILVGHPISIIQHPDGRHKHWAVRQNKLLVDPKAEDLFLSYTTDTLPGSSGSPAFNYDWELVAVHHSGVPRMLDGEVQTRANQIWRPGMPESQIDWVANEGARVSKIHHFLEGVRLPLASQQSLLASLVSASAETTPAPLESTPQSRQPSVITLENPDAPMQITVNGTAHVHVYSTPLPATIRTTQPTPDDITGSLPPPLAPEKKLRFDSNYAGRPGYKSDFLPGFVVPHPEVPAALAYPGTGPAKVLKYHHYSLVMHGPRRLAFWTAANIDYDEAKRFRARKEFGSDTWKPDPRIPIEAQIEDSEFYDPAKKFDRGHLVRRDDVAWGDNRTAEEFANSDSFHWTNCTPQHEHFNREMFQYKGLWGGLENHITTQAGFVQNKLILFAGPVLADDDPSRDFGSGVDVQVPLSFWKVVIAVETQAGGSARLRAYGFILDQTEAIRVHGWEGRFKAGRFKEMQVSLTQITARTQVAFAAAVVEADPLALQPEESRQRTLTGYESLRLR